MNLFNLMAKLTLDTSDYEKGIETAKKQGKEYEKQAEKTSAKSIISWTAISVAVGLIVKQMSQLISSTMQYADQIGDTAEKFGFTTKEIQEFDYWASQNGTTLDTLLNGMRQLSNQADADADAFKRLGVSVKDNNGNLKDNKALFLETIDALQKVENQTEKTALMQDVFGRSGLELGQVINLTSKDLEGLSQRAEDLGLIISDTAIKTASDFNDRIDEIKKGFTSVISELVAGTPEAEEKLNQFMENIKTFIRTYFPVFAKFLVNIVTELIQVIAEQLPDLIGVLIDEIFKVDWIQVGLNVGKAIIKGIFSIWKNMLGGFLKLFGVDVSGFESIGESKSTTTKLNEYTSNRENTTNIGTDNSKYDVEINISSNGYSQNEAKQLADEVIKQIATKKQARG